MPPVEEIEIFFICSKILLVSVINLASSHSYKKTMSVGITSLFYMRLVHLDDTHKLSVFSQVIPIIKSLTCLERMFFFYMGFVPL